MRIKITEKQLKNIIKESVHNPENLDEGYKDWVLSGLMVLASLGGLKAQTKKSFNQDEIKSAEMVQSRLESGDESILKYFSDIDIERNRKNLEKLKTVDIKSGLMKTSKVSNKDAQKKLKQGYVITDIKITKDTLIKDIPGKLRIDTSYQTKLSNDLFETAKYDVSNSIKSELDMIKKIIDLGAKVIIKNIESSTDKEPISIGNEKLAELRANSILQYLESIGVDVSDVVITTKPEQGPDIYTKTMSQSERDEARKTTAEFRYVKLDYDVIFFNIKPDIDATPFDVVEKIQFVMVRPKYKESTPRSKTKGTKCKIEISPNYGKKVVYKCPKNFKQ
jgi:outer membrane protein OmpA-like peptidoglycan-associated protein